MIPSLPLRALLLLPVVGLPPVCLKMGNEPAPAVSAPAEQAKPPNPELPVGGSGVLFFSLVDQEADSINLHVMEPDGRNRRNLTRKHAAEFDPAWSPDGRRIAFVIQNHDEEPRAGGLYVMNTDGTRTTRLTTVERHDAMDVAPVWSRDGRRIYFSRVEDIVFTGHGRVCRIDADGKNLTPVSPARSFDFTGEGVHIAIWMLERDAPRP